MAIKKSGVSKANDKFEYEVIEKCGVISEGNNGWATELRYVAWNGGDPKYDIRAWKETEDGEKMGKGITLTGEQLEALGNLIKEMESEG